MPTPNVKQKHIRDLTRYSFEQDDITAVLQNEAAEMEAGGRLIAPEGTYLIDGELPQGEITYDFSQTRLQANGANDVGLVFSGPETTIIDLEVTERERQNVLVRITGDGAVVDGATLGRQNKDTRDLMVYNEAALWIDGDEAQLSEIQCFNHAIGLRVHGRGHVITDSLFRDNICGVYFHPSCREVEFAYNEVHRNNVNHRSGAGGVLVHRNVSGLELHHCSISDSGEHGIYLQGDHCSVHNNRIWGNYAGGIKTGAYPTGLYWYDDEEPTQEYWQTNNVIRQNECWENARGRENSADIYVQSGQYLDETRKAHVKSCTIKQNKCSRSGNGIRIVYLLNQPRDTELSDIQVVDNLCREAQHTDISVQGGRQMLIAQNRADEMYVAGGRDYRIDEPQVVLNEIEILRLSNASRAHISENTITHDFSISGSVFRLRLTNNRRIVTSNMLNLRGIEVIRGNELIQLRDGAYFGGDERFVVIRDFSFNRIRREVRGEDSWYAWSTPFGVDFSMQMIGNVWELPADSRGVRIQGGSGHMVQTNQFFGSSELMLDVFFQNSVVAGNQCHEGGVMRLRPQSSSNRIYANSGFRLVDESGGANQLDNNDFQR